MVSKISVCFSASSDFFYNIGAVLQTKIIVHQGRGVIYNIFITTYDVFRVWLVYKTFRDYGFGLLILSTIFIPN